MMRYTRVVRSFFFAVLLFELSGQVEAQIWLPLNSGSGSTSEIRLISCPSENICYASSIVSNTIKTVDGGINWAPLSGIATGKFNVFPTVDTGIGVWGGVAIKTYDGGVNWVSQPMDTFPVMSIFFVNTHVGYVGGQSGVIKRTSDGGLTWQDRSYPRNAYIRSLYFVNPDTGYVAGEIMLGTFLVNTFVIKTTDGGNTWDSVLGIRASTSDNLNYTILGSCHFINADTGYAGGTEAALGYSSGVVYKTIDGAATWSRIIMPFSLRTSFGIRDVFFTSADIGYVLGGGTFMSLGISAILKTTDGGVNWALQTDTTANIPRMNDIYFPSPNVGYAVGLNGTILKTGGSVGINHRSLTKRDFDLSSSGEFRYTLKAPAKVKILLYDLHGRQALKLLDEERGAGEHALSMPTQTQPYILDYQAGKQRERILTKGR